MATNFPRDYAAPYDLACVNALADKLNKPSSFSKSSGMGFRDTEHITKDEDLISLRKDSRFNQILDISRQPFKAKPIIEVPKAQPAKATDGIVEVSAANFGYDGRTQIFLGLVVRMTAIAPITKLKGTTGELLSKWYEESYGQDILAISMTTTTETTLPLIYASFHNLQPSSMTLK